MPIRLTPIAAAAALLVAFAAAPTAAAPIAIGFAGTVSTVDDPAGIFEGLPQPAGAIEGSFVLDPEAGTVSFGDGTTGQRLPSGSAIVDGTYRYGGGAAGNQPPEVVLFQHCFLGTVLGFQCVPGQGSDAYVVEFPALVSDGFAQSFTIVLVGGGGDSVLPPPLDSFETAEFLWRFSASDRTAVVEGSINAIGVIGEPSSLALCLIAMLVPAARRLPRRTRA